MKLIYLVLPVLFAGLAFADIAPDSRSCCSTSFILGLVIVGVLGSEALNKKLK